MGHGRDAHAVELHVVGRDIGLAADDQSMPLEQVGLVPPELLEQHALLLSRRLAVDRREVEEDHEHPAALDVAQELVAEPSTLGRTLDQTGDVGQDELVLVVADHTEVRFEGRERVVADLRARRADRRDQRRLPGVREADERGVGHELELEAEPAVFAVLALLRERRRATCVREEPRVAPSTPTAVRGQEGVAVVHQVGEQLAVLVEPHDRAFGHGDDEIAPALAVLLRAGSVRPALALAVWVVTEGEERRDVAVGLDPDIAALATVATVGPTARHMGLATERDRTRPAVATLDVQLRFVDEAHEDLTPTRIGVTGPAPRWFSRRLASVAGGSRREKVGGRLAAPGVPPP